MLCLRRLLVVFAFAIAPAWGAVPELPLLHPLFSDHAVLQREKPLPVWGWTEPGADVDVTLGGKTLAARANANGRWELVFPPLRAGTPPLELTVTSGGRTARVSDLLVGEVWLCSGQSNMAWALKSSRDGAAAIAAADKPQLRLFQVQGQVALKSRLAPGAAWKVCTPETAAGFSGVGYFFSERLQRELGVPVGIINASYGGSSIDAWISPEALSDRREFAGALASLAAWRDGADPKENYAADMAAWYERHDRGARERWDASDSAAAREREAWRTVELPASVEKAAGETDFDGIVWFRRTLTLDSGWVGADAKLSLGTVDDRDTVWINGQRVGGMDRYSDKRDYIVASGLLREGENEIVVRVLDVGGGGGFFGKPDQLFLSRAGGARVELAGQWLARVSLRADDAPGAPLPPQLSLQHRPTGLYHGMLAGLPPFATRGVIWYQGETMSTTPRFYGEVLLPLLVNDWRARFRDPALPFGIVQLPEFGKPDTTPAATGWSGTRAAQASAARAIPGAFLITTLGAGEANDIHPRDKRTVGERVARRVLHTAYGAADPASGPVPVLARQETGGEVRIEFSATAGGLVFRPAEGRPSGFALRGADGAWRWAEVRVAGDAIFVSSAEAAEPTALRYAWSGNPPVTLFGGDGLPAAPFELTLSP